MSTASWFQLLPALVLLSASLSAAAPVARVRGLTFDAEDFFRDNDAETIELKGNVQVVSENQHIRADRARFSLRSNQAELDGNVRITNTNATIGGQRVLLDYESGTGVIYNGYVQSGPVIFEGSIIQKTGPDEYYVVEADYTTCTNCPPAWNFTGSSIRAELGGYAYIRNSILRIGSVPVFYLPYLVVPLKSDRQSGLLTPGFEQSSAGGLAISQPYFWAISRSTDATLTVKNYELRGLKGLVNYRYLTDAVSGGELDVGTINDRVFKDQARANIWRPTERKNAPIDRWFVKYSHYQELPSGWVHRAVVNNASDLQYPRDFPDETQNHGDSAMENRISMTKNTRGSHFSVDSSYYINLLEGDPLAGNDDAVHRLPEIRYAQLPQAIGKSGFYYTLDLDYANFTRSGPGYDNLTAGTPGTVRFIPNVCNTPSGDGRRYCPRTDDGTYDSGTDLIRTGQRLDIQPTISYPVTLGTTFDLLPKIAYRETHYNFSVGDAPYNVRRYVRAELAGRTSFSRVYGDLSPKGTRYKHEIRPEITYTTLPSIQHDSHDFFGFAKQSEAPTFENYSVSDEDLAGTSGLQFDYRDRIFDRNLLTYSVVNTVIQKRWINEVPVYHQLALIKLSQSYDQWKDSQNDPNKQPWSDISLLADLRFDRFQTNSLVNYYPYQKVTATNSRLRVNDDEGRFVQFGLIRRYNIVPGQDVDASSRVEDYTLASGFVSNYLNLMGKVVYNAVTTNPTERIKSWAYIAQLKPPGECWVLTFIHNQITGGDTNLKLGFEFNFDGAQKPPIPASELDRFGF